MLPGGLCRMRKTIGLLILLLAARDLGAAAPARTVLVFPFDNRSARSDLGWISEGIAEVLSMRLTGPARYVLGREERNGAYALLGIPPATPVTLASSFKIAETLGVDWAVMGNFSVEGRELVARAQLLDMRRLKLAPPLEVAGELADLVDLETRLAWRLLAANDPSFTVGKEEDFRRQFPEVRLDAFENYIRGVLAIDDESRLRFLGEADRLEPSNHRAAFELGRTYFDQKDYADSAKWLQKLDESDEDYLEALFRLAVDEFFLGHPQAAEKALEALAKQVPLNEVWNNLGVMKARRGHYAEALSDFNRAYQGDPTDADFCFNLAACLWDLKRYEEAGKFVEQGLRLSDDDAEAHSLRAVVLAKLGNPAGQSRELQWLAEHEGGPTADLPEDFSPQARLKKNYDGRAFRLLSLAVRNSLEERLAGETAANHGNVHLARGQKFLEEGRLAEAERELAEATSLLPGDTQAHLVLGQVYEAQGRHREAAAELETSLKLKNSASAHLWLARVYLSLDQPEAARPHGQAALALDPGNHDAERLIDQIRARAATSRHSP